MKLELDIILKDLDDKPIKDESGHDVLMSKWIANLLAQHSQKGNAAQYFDWSMQLWRTGAIADIDKNNIEKLKGFIENLDEPVLVIGQILEHFKCLV